MTVRTAARARTTRSSATPVKSTRKPAAQVAATKAKPAATPKRTAVSTTSTARRPVSTPPAGRPKTAAATKVAAPAVAAATQVAVATPAPVMAHRGPVLARKTLPPVPLGPPIDFQIGDKAVHPKHGVGEITAIEHRELGGTKGMFYILKILDNGMKVMVPTNAASQAGLRGIMSGKEADAVIDTMRAREVAVDLQPWSRRFRAYTEMVQSGLPHEVAKVLRDMHRLKFDKDLSFGERHLLDRAKSLLMKELAFAKKVTEAVLAEEVAGIFRN